MPQIIQPAQIRTLMGLARGINQAQAIAQQQQGGVSGQVIGAGNAWNEQSLRWGVLFPYPDPATNGSMQTTGVGMELLKNGDTPIARWGNLRITWQDGTTVTEAGIVLLDSAGNARVLFTDAAGVVFYDSSGTLLGYPQYTSTSWW